MNTAAQPSVFLLLGSNMGNRMQLLERACSLLQQAGVWVERQSSVYETAPWGFEAEQNFLNMALQVRTPLAPLRLLQAAQQVERQLGRTRALGAGYASRTIDVDILLYGGEVVAEPLLAIPHPRLHERRFALAPLAEIAPEFVHPTLQKTVAQLLRECSDAGSVWVSDCRVGAGLKPAHNDDKNPNGVLRAC
ncbi:MAG: 2-amino-4-hydroxy-6-hydroxymethyldihydropteridine diphosphokinase [Prevotellaceae bacterium]|jgi:2-amino-4-hydroxy-6-hydroxymethyldihydropteridine diphosphokinase|nr:2-amino-4-hydroxy-6-hydroxymethyldihydropteridine diphosphokinase [Prevotellaceae bacterium]